MEHEIPVQRRAAQEKIRKEQGERLRQARLADGRYRSASEAARAHRGIAISTYIAMENGGRGIGHHADYLSKHYRVSLSWLLYGVGPMRELDQHPLMAAYHSLTAEGQKYVQDAVDYALFKWGKKDF